MTDQTSPIVNDQASTPLPPVPTPTSPEPPKTTIFGGDINFNDATAFESINTPPEITIPPSEALPPEPPSIETSPIELSPIESSPIASPAETTFDDFDPFGNEEEEQEGDSKEENNEEHRAENEKQKENTEEQEENNEEVEEEQEENDEEVEEEQEQEEENEEQEEENKENNEEGNEEHVHEEEQETVPSENELITKFLHLVNTSRKIFTLQDNQQSFTLLGGKTTKTTLEYHIYLVEDEEQHIDLFIKRVETDNDTQEEVEHLLQRSYTTDSQHLDIFVDEILLYQIGKKADDRTIIDKLDKFGFLFETFLADLNKAYLEKKETENKKKQLHEIFRNF